METEKELLSPELKAEILKLIKDNLSFELAPLYDRHFNPSMSYLDIGEVELPKAMERKFLRTPADFAAAKNKRETSVLQKRYEEFLVELNEYFENDQELSFKLDDWEVIIPMLKSEGFTISYSQDERQLFNVSF